MAREQTRWRVVTEFVVRVARSRFGLRTADQGVLVVLTTLALILLTVHWVRLTDWGQEVVLVTHRARVVPYRIDINRANWVQWSQLEGIGPELSRRIVKNRKERGPFESIEELQRVRGVGPRVLERIRDSLENSQPVLPMDSHLQ